MVRDARASRTAAKTGFPSGPVLSTPRSSTVFRALWVVLLFAGSVRVVYWLVYARTMPFLTHPLADAGIYEGWATAIAQGDVWSRAAGVFYRAPLYPYFLAAIHVGFGETMPWAGLLQSALGIVLLWMVSRLAWRIAGPRAAIASR